MQIVLSLFLSWFAPRFERNILFKPDIFGLNQLVKLRSTKFTFLLISNNPPPPHLCPRRACATFSLVIYSVPFWWALAHVQLRSWCVDTLSLAFMWSPYVFELLEFNVWKHPLKSYFNPLSKDSQIHSTAVIFCCCGLCILSSSPRVFQIQCSPDGLEATCSTETLVWLSSLVTAYRSQTKCEEIHQPLEPKATFWQPRFR